MHVTRHETIERELVPTDPDMRARYLAERERRLHAAAVAERCDAFRAAVRAGDHRLAGRLFLGEVGCLEQLALIRACEGREMLAFLRGAKRELRDAILAAHPGRDELIDALIPDDKLPRYVRIEPGTGIAYRTSPRELTREQAAKLRAAGVPLKEIFGDKAPGDPEFRYPGWRPSDALSRAKRGDEVCDTEPEAMFLARLEVDDELRTMIESGAITISTITKRGRTTDHEVIAKLRGPFVSDRRTCKRDADGGPTCAWVEDHCRKCGAPMPGAAP